MPSFFPLTVAPSDPDSSFLTISFSNTHISRRELDDFKLGALLDFKLGALLDFKLGALLDFRLGALEDFRDGALEDFRDGALEDFRLGAFDDLDWRSRADVSSCSSRFNPECNWNNRKHKRKDE